MDRQRVAGRRVRRVVAAVIVCVVSVSAFAEPRLRVRVLAGSSGGSGHRDATGRDARFSEPRHMGTACDGSVVVADTASHTIRAISADGDVTTLAGTPYKAGSADGADARFRSPEGVAVAPDCSVWVADTGNHTIRRIAANGAVTTVAGQAGSSGATNGGGASSRFDTPVDLAFDPLSGDAFVVDAGSASVRRVTAGGQVSTLTAPAQALAGPEGIAVDPSGRLIVAELSGNAIRYRTTDGAWSRRTFSPTAYPGDAVVAPDGSIFVSDVNNSVIWMVPTQGAPVVVAGALSRSGTIDGAATSARFWQPVGVALLTDGTMAIADSRNALIRTYSSTGGVTTLAGQTSPLGSVDGVGRGASFRAPRDATESADGTVFVTDGTTVRRIAPDGTVTTLAGLDDVTGSEDGVGSAARFGIPYGIAVDSKGNVFVADLSGLTIRRIAPDGTVTTIAGVAGSRGSVDGPGQDARFDDPLGIAVDRDDNLYVADRGSHAIRRIDAGDYRVSTIAGKLGVIGSGDGPAGEARFFNPWDVTVDASGVVYVVDENNHVVQKIENGTVTTVGRTHTTLRSFGVAISDDGTLLVTESQSSVIRRVTQGGGESFMGARLEPGNRVGNAERARFSRPVGIDFGPTGRWIIADTENRCVKVAELVDGPWIDGFDAIPSTITGRPILLEWCTDGADSVTIMPDIGVVDPCGSVTVAPDSTTTYTLTARSAEGDVEQSVTVSKLERRRPARP